MPSLGSLRYVGPEADAARREPRATSEGRARRSYRGTVVIQGGMKAR